MSTINKFMQLFFVSSYSHLTEYVIKCCSYRTYLPAQLMFKCYFFRCFLHTDHSNMLILSGLFKWHANDVIELVLNETRAV